MENGKFYRGFTPVSQQTFNSQKFGMSNLNQSFFQPQNPLIEKTDFSNRGNTIHDNLGDKIMAEYINEYKLHISSEDRDESAFPSPFKIRVSLGNDNQTLSLPKKFKNIKYVSIDWIILPRVLTVDTTHVNDSPPLLFPTDSCYSRSPAPVDTPNPMDILINHKYIILKIDELSTDKNMGTSNLIDKNTFILYDDGKMGMDSVMWKSTHNTVYFPNSDLGTLSTLTFSLYDETGKCLTIKDENDNDIIKGSISGTNKNFNAFVKENESQQSVAYTNNIFQTTYSLTVGVLENELNTLANYA